MALVVCKRLPRFLLPPQDQDRSRIRVMAEEKSTKNSLAALRESAIEVVKGLADTFEDGLDTFAVRNAILPSREERPSRFIGAIDQGTTSTRFIIFDLQGSIAASHQTELGRVHDQPGFVFHLFFSIGPSVLLTNSL